MTEKLYDGDAALMTFDATVRACTPKGDRYEILLDKTAFFPCEGGQGADHGRIGGDHCFEADRTERGAEGKEISNAVINDRYHQRTPFVEGTASENLASIAVAARRLLATDLKMPSMI